MLDKKLGGLKMINIKDFITSIKIYWIWRLFVTSNKSLWIILFEKHLNVNLNKVIYFGPGYFQVLKKGPIINFG